MKTNLRRPSGRREFLRAAVAASLILGARPLTAIAGGKRIGVIGSGKVGGTIGELWARAGHEVMFSSRNIEHDKALAASVGHGARAGTSKEAAAFGEVLLFAVPYAALPVLGHELGEFLKGKVVLDACNPIPARDGEMAAEALAMGTGVASPQFLPGARIVRAFNCLGYAKMKSEAHRDGEKLGIPLAADDRDALGIAVGLVQDAGFEPVVVGGLARAKDFDYGTPIFGKPMVAAGVREILGVKP